MVTTSFHPRLASSHVTEFRDSFQQFQEGTSAATAVEIDFTFQVPQELQASVQPVLPLNTDGKTGGDPNGRAYISRFELDEPFQSAYKAIHSRATTLIYVQNDILQVMEEGKVGIFLLLDLSAAFNAVHHGTLLDHLHQELHVGSTALDWFECYLAASQLHFGMSQESVLGPQLFTVHDGPIGRIIRRTRRSRLPLFCG